MVYGGGIGGLATAMKLLEIQPGARLVVLEKEAGLSRHQTGHNSGVIHAGIYYAPGSLKADLCRRGSKATKEFCWNHRIPFETCGKLLVATNELELQRLIYPIPDPDLPFLGVHLTRMMDGSVTVGPNAVLGFAREGYPKFSFNLHDVAEYSTFPGFWKTILRNIQHGLKEMKNSIFKAGYLEACRKYCPSLEIGDLLPYEAGIRAQAVMKDGTHGVRHIHPGVGLWQAARSWLARFLS